MVKVYEWPPVVGLSRKWRRIDPIATSTSLITGGEYVSAAQRSRRKAMVEVSSRFSPYQQGDGYCRALAELLQGGINLVRLRYVSTAFECDLVPNAQRGGSYFGWTTPPVGFGWVTGVNPFVWFQGAELTYTVTTDAGLDAIVVSGLPVNSLVALPGEYVRFFNVAGATASAMVAAPATSDESGVATIRLTSTPPALARVSLGSYDEGVFKVDAIPDHVEPASGDWSWTWEFTEVFEDEGRGTFEDVNPWT